MTLLNYNQMIKDYLGQKIMNRVQPKNNNQGGMQGLLNVVQSPYGMDLATGLLAQSGYSPTPTSTGQALGVANQYATKQQTNRDLLDIKEIGAFASVLKNTAPAKATEFERNIKEFNRIDAIPVDQRTASENNAYKSLGKKLNMNDSLTEIIDNIAVQIANSEGDEKYELSEKQNQLIKLKQKLSILEQFGFDITDMDEDAGGGDKKDLKKDKEENVTVDISKATNTYTDKNGKKVYQFGDQFLYADGTPY
tara:strand:- start:5441 stop:6193 length:753 start_codon:yes stop_codon:yes gene_type:complete